MSLPTSIAPAPSASASPRRRFALRLLASLLVLGVLVSLLDRGEILALLADFARRSPLVWVGAVALFLLLHAGGALKWRLFLSLAGARLPARTCLRFYGFGLFANLCLPTMIGGDIVRAGLALGATPEKEAVVLGSVADRIADLVALVVLAVVASWISPSAREALAARSISPAAISAAFLGLLAVLLVAVALLLRFAARSALATRFAGAIPRLAGAWRALRSRPADAALGFAWCLALQTGFVLLNARIGMAIGLDLDLQAWFLVVPLAKIAAMVPLSLGGIGVREVAVVALTAPLRIARETAVAQSLVWQSVLIAGSLAAGGLAALGGIRPRDRS